MGKSVIKKNSTEMLQHNTGDIDITRRHFLRGAGASMAGLAAIGTAGLALKKTATASQTASGMLPYARLDPEKAMKMAYEGYSKGG